MASKALTSAIASPLVANRAQTSGGLGLGLGPRSIMLRPSTRRHNSLVVRAQDEPMGGEPRRESVEPMVPRAVDPNLPRSVDPAVRDPTKPATPPIPIHDLHHQPAMVHTPGRMRWAWSPIGTDDRSAKIQLHLPGLKSEQVKVTIYGDILNIEDINRIVYDDVLKFVLPFSCVGDEPNATATLDRGVLNVIVEKTISGPAHLVEVPVEEVF